MPSSQNTEYSYFNYITVRAGVQYKIANLYLLLSKVSCSDKGVQKCGLFESGGLEGEHVVVWF